jgi:transposase
MVRNYEPKKRRPWSDKGKRMARVVELRAMGWSLRKIADRLVVSEGTVRNDLKRWGHERPNVAPLTPRNPVAKKRPAGGEITQPNYAPAAAHQDADIVPIRRSS